MSLPPPTITIVPNSGIRSVAMLNPAQVYVENPLSFVGYQVRIPSGFITTVGSDGLISLPRMDYGIEVVGFPETYTSISWRTLPAPAISFFENTMTLSPPDMSPLTFDKFVAEKMYVPDSQFDIEPVTEINKTLWHIVAVSTVGITSTYAFPAVMEVYATYSNGVTTVSVHNYNYNAFPELYINWTVENSGNGRFVNESTFDWTIKHNLPEGNHEVQMIVAQGATNQYYYPLNQPIIVYSDGSRAPPENTTPTQSPSNLNSQMFIVMCFLSLLILTTARAYNR